MVFKNIFQKLKWILCRWNTYSYFNLWDLISIFFGLTIAWGLFQFGMNYPFDSRLTGDAYEYMQIASGFKGLSSILNFMGERTVGMPFFNWLLKPNGHFIEPDSINWVNRINYALFSLHIVASFIFVFLASRYAQLKSPWSLRFLLICFLSFPAFVGHTTTPLTDTLAVDVSLIMLALALYSYDQFHFYSKLKIWTYLTSALTGVLLLFLILLRPAYLVPIIASLVILVVLVFFAKKENRNLLVTKLLLVLGVTFGGLFFVSSNCHSKYGAPFCLQNPKTFEPVRHAQMGLKGGRLLWSAEYPGNGEFPIVSDSTLKSNFYDRCHLKKIVGTEKDSLLGCLISQPLLLPIYIVKKWIGLFDHFRFQPYVELETPLWLKNMSRSYDLLAWIGFLFLVIYPLQVVRRIVLRSPSIKDSSSWTPALLGPLAHPISLAYFIFVALMLSEHTILHPEDRFGLVAIPLALISFAKIIEYSVYLFKNKKLKILSVVALSALVWMLIFTFQIQIWDQTPY